MEKQNKEIVKGLLRFSTAGSVDDGKSTLIGRLLYDSKTIYEDQLEHITDVSNRKGEESIDLSLLTDGLKAEREQGITIDVAYRYFSTPKRKFIIADTPGHIQYTRNMVTGASTVDLAVILIDARNGVREQTIRHTYITSLLGIKHIVFCINKMDLIDYSEAKYLEIKENLMQLSNKLEIKNAYYIPISAKLGDNVVEKSDKMNWYNGDTFLGHIESIRIFDDADFERLRFPVQYVIRPKSNEFHDFRGYAGRIESGTISKHQKVRVLPCGFETRIKNIYKYNQTTEQALPSDCVTITLEDEIDISRGDIIVNNNIIPQNSRNISAMICWFSAKAMQLKGKYILRHGLNEFKCMIDSIDYKVNINNLENLYDDKTLIMNEIAKINIITAKEIYFEKYAENKSMGSIILIDEATNETIAAGMIG
jgi:sulfate adenylyltransferase subunit 1